MNQKKHIVIFGASGFIGTHLVRTVLETMDVTLTAVDIAPPRVRITGVHYVTADVRNLANFDVQGEVSTIYNLAAVHTTPGHPVHEYYETNVLGATEICAFARRKGVEEIVFTSSISVYGPAEDAKIEETSPAPLSAYGWSKLLAERIHQAWAEEHADRRLVICRPAVVFGFGEGGNFTRLAGLLRKGFFVYPGRKDTIKACFYVGDLIEALLYANAQKSRFILFNGCYPDHYTLENIVEIFRREHFPNAKTFLLPRVCVTVAAALLRPFSVFGLGIEPERVMKLVYSTNIVPGWLTQQGQAKPQRLVQALSEWDQQSEGRFC